MSSGALIGRLRTHHRRRFARSAPLTIARCAALCAACYAAFGAAPAAVAAPPMRFREVGVPAGLGGGHPGAVSAPPVAPGGVAGDFDGDGWQDLFYATGGGAPDRLFINRRDGTFADRAGAAGVARAHRAHGAAAADYDGDGALDLFIPSAGPDEPGLPPPGHLLLYRGDGRGAFTCCAPYRDPDGRLDRGAGGMAAAFGDYDLDGDLDLFAGGWASGIRGNVLFRNDGDGGFTEVGARAGVADDGVIAFAAQFVDLNGDRYPELIVAGDFGSSRYYRNDGDGTFTDLTFAAGVGREANGMGSAVADLNGDGRPDWYVTSVSTRWPIHRTPGTGNALYLNAGGDRFREAAGVAQVRDGGWGWGAAAVDLDHDGRRDLVTATGWIEPNGAGLYEWRDQQAFLFRNTGADAAGVPAFERIDAARAGLRHRLQGRALLTLDYDRDGDRDVVIFNFDARPSLFRNDLGGPAGPSAASGTGWLRVFLEPPRGSGVAPHGWGAVVTVTAAGRTQAAAIGAGGFFGASEMSAHFGLGAAARVDQLTVDWPDGARTVLRGVAADQTITIRP